LSVVPAADGARLTLQVKGTAAVEAVTATLMVPPGYEVVADSARLDGKPLPVERNDNMVSARLGAHRGEWTAQFELDLRGSPAGNATVRAVTQLRSGGDARSLPTVQAEIGAAPAASAPSSSTTGLCRPPRPPRSTRRMPSRHQRAYAAGAERFDAPMARHREPGFEIVFRRRASTRASRRPRCWSSTPPRSASNYG